MFQKYDKSTKIRHLKKPNAAISTRADVPSMRALFGIWAHFNVQPSELQAYRNAQSDRKRSVNFTIIFGSTIPMANLLEKSVWDRNDVVEGGSIHIEIKALQAVETEKAFIIIATPTFCSEENLTKVLHNMLQQGIEAAKKKKPTKYKSLPDLLPEFALQSDFIQGLPWKKEEESDKEKIKPYMKKPFHFMTKTEDYDDWKVILGLLERTDNLKRLFGGGAFIIDNRDYGMGRGNRSEDEVNTLEECQRRHIWAQKNTGLIQVRGARNLDTPCRIRKAVTDENGHLCNGEEHGYQIDQEMTLREIMMKIKAKDTPIFLLIANKDGKSIAFHRNTYEEVKNQAKRFESEPAGHIMHWLLQRGIEGEDIYNLLRTTFSEEEAAGALETRLEGGRVISQRTLEREKSISHFDKLNPEVDITQGMRGAEVIEYQKKQAIASLRDAAFHGKSNLDLGEKNEFFEGDGTVYTRRNDTLGDTQFDEDDEWGDDANNDEEDFGLYNWDEERLNTLVRVDMGKMYQREEKDEAHSSRPIRDREELNRSKGVRLLSRYDTEKTGDFGEEETDAAVTAGGARKTDNNLKEKYPTSPAQDGARGMGEETK
jgi:hypothetical protein